MHKHRSKPSERIMTDNAINTEQTSLIFQNSSRERLIHSCKVPPLRVSSSHAVTPHDPLHGSSGPALSRRETCLHTRDHHNWIHHWQEHCFPQSSCCLIFNTILHYLHYYYFFLSFSSVWICRMDHAAARGIVHMHVSRSDDTEFTVNKQEHLKWAQSLIWPSRILSLSMNRSQLCLLKTESWSCISFQLFAYFKPSFYFKDHGESCTNYNLSCQIILPMKFFNQVLKLYTALNLLI